MKLRPMAVCCTCTSPCTGAGTSTSSRRMTSGPPTSCIRIVRGIGISMGKGLRRVTPLPVLGEIQTFGLLLFRHAQSREYLDELEDQPGPRPAPRERRGDADRLH